MGEVFKYCRKKGFLTLIKRNVSFNELKQQTAI